MEKITRSDVYARDEKGPAWFSDFLYNFAQSQESPQPTILDAITSKKGETVQGVVNKYREMVGLDALAEIEEELGGKVATASAPISIRQAKEKDKKEVVLIIEEDQPELKSDIESLCEHSGGHKDTHAIIKFLRDELGSELVSFSDKDLIDYINDIKGKYVSDTDEQRADMGRVGTDDEVKREDDVADYVAHSTGDMGGR